MMPSQQGSKLLLTAGCCFVGRVHVQALPSETPVLPAQPLPWIRQPLETQRHSSYPPKTLLAAWRPGGWGPCPAHRGGAKNSRATSVLSAATAATVPPALQLVSAAAVPVAKVALFCAVGAWAASRGLLPADGRRVLSALCLNILTPCLLFSKLAVGVGLGDVTHMWPVTANMVASHVVGLLLGLFAVRLARVPYRLQNQVVLSCGIGNVGNLPFVLVAGLAADPALPFAAALGPAAAGEQAMRYVALSNLSAALIQFPLTYIFLQKPYEQPYALAPSPPADGGIRAGLGASGCSGGSRNDHHCGRERSSSAGEGGGGVGSSCSSTSSAEEGADSGIDGVKATSAAAPTGNVGNAATAPTAAAAAASAAATTAAATAFPTSAGDRWRSVAAGVFTPPTLLSLAAVAVASVDWLRDALFSPSGCLRMVGELSDALGAACIPVLLLVLGANLSRGPGVAAGRLPGACVVAAVVTRLLLLPAVCGAALLGAWRADLLPGTDSLAMLVMLVMHATPTAVLVHSMATIYGNAEDEVAALLFWQYLACLVTLPLAIGLMLQLLIPAAAAVR